VLADAAIDREQLSIHIGRIVAGEEAAAAAISSARPGRFIGVTWPSLASTPRARASSNTFRVNCVSTRPGKTALTRTPVPAKALAAVCARLFTAPCWRCRRWLRHWRAVDAADEVRMIEP